MALLHSPRTSDTNGAGHHGDGGMDLRTAVTEITLLPTPAVNDMGAAYTPDEWDAWTAEMKAKHNNGNGHGKSLNVEAQRMLPTPTRRDHKDSEIRREPHRPDDVDTLARALTDVPAALLPTPNAGDAKQGHVTRDQHEAREAVKRSDNPNLGGLHADLPYVVGALLPTPTAQDSAQSGGGYNGQTNVTLTDATVRQPDRWGEYGPGIRRQEAMFGRPAPEPTKPNAKGNPKLSDEFDEWLMGYPAGWITDVPGVTWNETLKACGNGVVPQQGAAAVPYLLALGSAR